MRRGDDLERKVFERLILLALFFNGRGLGSATTLRRGLRDFHLFRFSIHRQFRHFANVESGKTIGRVHELRRVQPGDDRKAFKGITDFAITRLSGFGFHVFRVGFFRLFFGRRVCGFFFVRGINEVDRLGDVVIFATYFLLCHVGRVYF